MVKRTNHYDVAFEEYLRGTCTPYVAVDEQRRALLADASLKSMDFIVTSKRFQNLLVDVKGRRFPSGGDGPGSGHKWENWATEDDIESLLRWQQVFGNGFRSMLLFAYEIVDLKFARELGRPFVHQGRLYSFLGVFADQYHLAMQPRSASWETVSVRSREFRDLRMPISELLECSRTAFRWLTPWQGTRLRMGARLLGALCVTVVGGGGAMAAGTVRITPLLAQESSGEGGYPILEWAIVVLLIGVALFGICRSSRRN